MLLSFGNMKTVVALLFAVTSLVSGINAKACFKDGWIPYQGHCYHIGYGTDPTFFEAWAYCKHRGTYLVRLDTLAEYTFLAGMLKKTNAGYMWMGLTDISHEGIWRSWRWCDSKDHAIFSDWAAGEANNDKGDEDYVHFVYNIIIKTFFAMLLFYLAVLGEVCYKSRGAYLVRLETPGEYVLVKEYLKETRAITQLIGSTDMYSEEKWQWVDSGKHIQFSDWAYGQPDNSGNEDCVHLNSYIHNLSRKQF